MDKRTGHNQIGIVISGACGRMGKAVRELTSESNEFIVKALIESRDHASIGERVSLGKLQGNADLSITSSFPDCLSGDEIVIDFSTREALPFLLKEASKRGLRYVCGTTGLSASHMEMLRGYSKESAVLYDSNMSFGIAVIKRLLRLLSGLLQDDFDVEIIERHHKFKKDKPSGTAISLAAELGGDLARRHEPAPGSPDAVKEPKIHSIRAGGIVGKHEVIFASSEEIIEIAHSALTRRVFARGALRATRFLSSQRSGFFSLQDLIEDGKNT